MLRLVLFIASISLCLSFPVGVEQHVDVVLRPLPNGGADPQHTCATTSEEMPWKFPVFKQCDDKWGSDLIETKTVCQVGCLMSSIASALNGRNIQVDHSPSTPHSLNAFLRANKGYDADNNLDESAVTLVNPSNVSWNCSFCGMYLKRDLISKSEIKQWLEMDRIVIANVDAGHHFVLVVGVDEKNDDVIFVNDSGFDRNCYPYSEVVGWRVFDIPPHKN